MKDPKIEKVEMYKCDACEGYHSADESEIVVLKVIKGKKCDINKVRNKKTESPVIIDRENIDIPSQGYIQSDRKKTIIPPGIESLMVGPESHDFESKGDKMVRKV